ncbi:MAG: hypothetical protein V4480_04160 [Patescibacteria group bacterium]
MDTFQESAYLVNTQEITSDPSVERHWSKMQEIRATVKRIQWMQLYCFETGEFVNDRQGILQI